jgi:iron complex outermembrane receptor protein
VRSGSAPAASRRLPPILGGLAALSLLASSIAHAQDPPPEPRDPLPEIEDLMNVQVSSLARKNQSLGEVPAALHVVTGDDLRRMGVTHVAEGLRAVPGMQVGRTRSNIWAVSARGFNDNLSNKLLVLMDGRSVYSPLHSGVFWDVQDPFLEDVDRIEVIRGPGGSLWGANAINGIVNVITKSADQTQGLLLAGGGGTEERAFGGFRYGFEMGEDHFARVFAKFNVRDDAADGVDPDEHARDAWQIGHAGFRSDLKSGDGRFTLMGDFYGTEQKERSAIPDLGPPSGIFVRDTTVKARGGHFLVRWERELGGTSDLVLQLYYDYTFRHQELFEDVVHTGDLDFQHRFRPLDGHEATWGLGYRIYRNENHNSFPFQTNPEDRTDDIVSAFVQDEVGLVEDLLSLTLGSKFEYNDYSGFEYQPAARLSWKPVEDALLWAAVTRAVRTPSIIDVSGRLTPIIAPGLVASIFGAPDFRTEVLIAYEAGMRFGLKNELVADASVFFNRYDRLRSGATGGFFIETDPPPAHFVIPIQLGNDLDGEVRGAEASVRFQASAACAIRASYAWLKLHLSEEPAEGRDPEHTAWIRASYDFSGGWTFDAMSRYVSRLRTFDVDKYIEADARIAWRPGPDFEAALAGQNLFRDSHEEFQAETQRSEIERGVYLSLRWEL